MYQQLSIYASGAQERGSLVRDACYITHPLRDDGNTPFNHMEGGARVRSLVPGRSMLWSKQHVDALPELFSANAPVVVHIHELEGALNAFAVAGRVWQQQLGDRGGARGGSVAAPTATCQACQPSGVPAQSEQRRSRRRAAKRPVERSRASLSGLGACQNGMQVTLRVSALQVILSWGRGRRAATGRYFKIRLNLRDAQQRAWGPRARVRAA